jgi:hypothetical protein
MTTDAEHAEVLRSVMLEHSPDSDLVGDYDCRFGEGQMLAFKRAIEVLRAAPTWQPIATAPRDGTRVLLYLPNHYPGACAIGVWNDEWTDKNRAWIPTRWMPLPAAPKDEP